MANGLNEFMNDIRTTNLGTFTPAPFFETDSDSLIFYARNERSHRKRLNSVLTLFLSTDDDSLVGCEVKGVTRILRQVKLLKASGFGVLVQDHKIKLAVFLAFALAPAPEDPALEERYEDDLEELGNTDVDFPELACAAG